VDWSSGFENKRNNGDKNMTNIHTINTNEKKLSSSLEKVVSSNPLWASKFRSTVSRSIGRYFLPGIFALSALTIGCDQTNSECCAQRYCGCPPDSISSCGDVDPDSYGRYDPESNIICRDNSKGEEECCECYCSSLGPY